jgi:hypothetical protein
MPVLQCTTDHAAMALLLQVATSMSLVLIPTAAVLVAKDIHGSLKQVFRNMLTVEAVA